ncbi:putative membrane protein YqjE [Comamonas sp. BIGb0124]|uniref:phage holin family protein n=1 Tax=Comamonas sp. BIGb0124 TaxID=2485130 RepID=UPI000F490386|nr:phage holin family protein [Comamonas sp. BIGb0124]ROR25060.1 putative membrane protein YqjE [Comamonas sp. BIGb0124]
MLERLYSLLGLELWVNRARHAAAEGAVAVEDRWLLARIEWAEEKRRMLKLVLLTIAALALTIVALVVLSFAVMASYWDTPHRATAVWVVAGIWLVGWAAALYTLISTARASGQAFQGTRDELARDWATLKEKL